MMASGLAGHGDAEYVFAGKPACVLVLTDREDSYGSDG
jgi:hypothetical protein